MAPSVTCTHPYRLRATLRVLQPKENLSHDCNDLGNSVVIVTDELKRNRTGADGASQIAISRTLLGCHAVDCSDRFRWFQRWRGRTRKGSVAALRTVQGHECLDCALQVCAEAVGGHGARTSRGRILRRPRRSARFWWA